ncbi:MAG: hypothetical protein GY711_12090 [bacterium]|nr:hypothetical protein [bacterium]
MSSPRATAAARDVHRWWGIVALCAYAYPALLVSSFYLTWFGAWLVLGHAPRPNLDDPRSIGLLVDVPYIATMVLMIGFPAAIVLGVVMTPVVVVRRAPSGGKRLLFGFLALAGLALLWSATLWFLRADPWDVGTWYMD